MKRRNYLMSGRILPFGLLLFGLAMLLSARGVGAQTLRWTYGSGGIFFNDPDAACQGLVDDAKGPGFKVKTEPNPNPELKDCYYFDKINNNVLSYVAFVYLAIAPDATPTPTPTPTPESSPSPTPVVVEQPADPFALISLYRGRNHMPNLDLRPRLGCASGTVAYLREGGREFYGVNSTLEREYLKVDNEALRRTALEELQRAGKLSGATYNGAGQFLTHAEAEALLKAKRVLGKLPQKMTLYVDRPLCNMCNAKEANGLPVLLGLYGVEELNVTNSLGETTRVTPQGRGPCGQ